ncbi:MAG: hypothetical protein HQL10_13955 [Nitrospirae bacterium]|nr:hypothetical protein [Nitrospirota bacterium]
MRKITATLLSAILILIFTSGVSFSYEKELRSLSTTIVSAMDKVGSRKSVAIMDFTDSKGKVTDLGNYLSDELTQSLKNAAQGFEVREREDMRSAFSQNNLTITIPFNTETVKKINQDAKLGAIVLGSYTAFSDKVKVSISIVNTYQAKVVGSTSVEIPRTRRINELLGAGQDSYYNLTGVWRSDDGGLYYIRQIGNKVWWFGESSPNNPSWSNAAYGEIIGNEMRLQWADVPKGYSMNSGSLVINIISNGGLTAIDKRGSFGGSDWIKQ